MIETHETIGDDPGHEEPDPEMERQMLKRFRALGYSGDD